MDQPPGKSEFSDGFSLLLEGCQQPIKEIKESISRMDLALDRIIDILLKQNDSEQDVDFEKSEIDDDKTEDADKIKDIGEHENNILEMCQVSPDANQEENIVKFEMDANFGKFEHEIDKTDFGDKIVEIGRQEKKLVEIFQVYSEANYKGKTVYLEIDTVKKESLNLEVCESSWKIPWVRKVCEPGWIGNCNLIQFGNSKCWNRNIGDLTSKGYSQNRVKMKNSDYSD